MCYEEGENVSLRETVARAAVAVGVPGGEAYALSGDGMHELTDALRTAKINGKRVSSAPTFNVSVGKAAHDFSGAQDAESWVSIFEHFAELIGVR